MTTEDEPFDPREYMKSRRPHLFPDSKEQELPPFDKALLEYTLETLTSRQEEIRFEQFALHLAKKLICPNLIPHTGPTGGGDGKTDSENYQVSEEISALWYIGDPKRASSEKFAFCFSAKKDWDAKFKSDISSVQSTGRNFSVIYFITNQFVASKKRADLQDKYSKETGKDIKILDRNWITESVFDNELWNIVAQHLGIGEVKTAKSDGPRAAANRSYLEELEREIAETEYQGLNFAEDCFEAALIARNLGLPMQEVVGRFERAERASEKAGSKLQLFRIIYKRAWTAYFWYKDFEELSRLYEKAEDLVKDVDSAFVLQDLSSLCQIGLTVCQSNKFSQFASIFAERSSRLRRQFEKIARDFPNTTNGLWAETYIAILAFASSVDDQEKITKLSKALLEILPKARLHAGYPIEIIYQIVVKEVSAFIVDNDAFDQLFEMLMDIQSQRVSESEKGENRLQRGLQLHEKGKNYQAIDQLTKAQVLLAQNENIEKYPLAVFAAGVAYRDVGLLWAARANMAVATSLFIQSKTRSGELIPGKVLLFLQEYMWTELLLGRPLCALQVLELALLLAGEMNVTDSQAVKFQLLDEMFARVCLLSTVSDLSQLESLPNGLRKYLELSASVLLFCLGHVDLAKEWLDGAEIDEIAKTVLTNTEEAFANSLPPNWYWTEPYFLHSKILGCEIELKAHELTGILIGESLIAFVENFLATAVMLKNCIATQSRVTIEIHNEQNSNFKIEEIVGEYGEITLKLNYWFLDLKEFADPPKYSKRLFEVTIEILKNMGLTFTEESLIELFASHEVLSRSQFAASSLTSVLKLFGEEPKYFLRQWLTPAGFLGDEESDEPKNYELTRTEPWIVKNIPTGKGKNIPISESNASEIPDMESWHQSEFSIHTVVDSRIWAQTRWNGTAFGVAEGKSPQIEFWLTFENIEPARKIFMAWKNKVGDTEDNWLSASIITGINADYPSHYRVVFAVKDEFMKSQRSGTGLMTVSPLVLDVTPKSSASIDMFLDAFKKYGWYDLGPAKASASGLEPDLEFTIRKRELCVIPAWQINEKNVLVMALKGITNPLIPNDISNPPIHAAIKKYFDHRE